MATNSPDDIGKFIVFGKRHLDYLISEFTNYYNTARSQMVRDYLSPIRDVSDEVKTLALDRIEVKSYVGGLVRSLKLRRRDAPYRGEVSEDGSFQNDNYSKMLLSTCRNLRRY